MSEPSREQLVAALRRADAAGDEAAARAIARRLSGQQKPAQPKAPPRNRGTGIKAIDRTTSWINEAAIGGVQGLVNMGAALTDPITGLIDPKGTKAAQRQRQQFFEGASRTVSPNRDPIARASGQVASSLLPVNAIRAPAAVARFAPRAAAVATRAAQGALGGAAVRDSDQSAAVPMAIGAAANVAIPYVGGKLANTRLGQAAIRKGGQFFDDVLVGGSQPRAVPSQADDLALLGDDALERMARFERVGVREPTTGMVTRDPTAWTRERNLQMLTEGVPVKESLLSVNDDLLQAGQRMTAGAPGREAVGANARGVITQRREALGNQVSGLYTRAREEFGDAVIGRPQQLLEALDDPAIRNSAVGKTFASQVRGFIDDVAPDGNLNVSQAEELRKFIGRLGGNDGTDKFMRGQLTGALDDSVFSSVGDDAFGQARNAARQRFQEFESGAVAKMADGGMFDEQLTKRMVQGGMSNQQIRDLYKTLGAEGDVGQQTIDQIRRQALSDIIENPTAIMDDGTTTTINGKTIYNAFERNKDRYKVIFGDDMFGQVDDYVKTIRDATVQPATATPNNSATAAMLMNGREGLLGQAFAEPVAPQAGLLVRNAPTVGGGIGGLLGSAVGGPLGGMTGGSAGSALGKGVQALSRRSGERAVANATAQQVQAAVNPQTAAQALRMLQDRNLDAATRASILAWWDKAIGPHLGAATMGLGSQ